VLSLREAREVNVRNNGDSMSVCLSACLPASQFAFVNLQILTNFSTFFRTKAMINLQGKKSQLPWNQMAHYRVHLSWPLAP
jgi:hypothetical protein